MHVDNGRFLLWIQPDAAYGLPVSRIARPAGRVLSASDLIKGMAPGKNGVILARVALCRRRYDVLFLNRHISLLPIQSIHLTIGQSHA